MKRILVLLIGEVLSDPRVYKTCCSLTENGCEVTVGCTNPNQKPHREKYNGLSIIRFPHRNEFVLKRLYQWFQSNFNPRISTFISNVHEKEPISPLKKSFRNAILRLNHAHFIKSTINSNAMMVKAFAGESFDLVHCNDVDTLHAGCELKRCGSARYLLYDAHEYWPGMGVYGSKTNLANRDYEARGIKDTDFVVTVNPMIAELLVSEYKLKTRPSVMMNCPYRYDGTLSIDSIHSPVRIIYQGKLQAYRGLPELVLAFKDIDNGVLILSGYGPLFHSLQHLVTVERLRDKVVFVGQYNPHESMKICADHDIGVIPYLDVTQSNRYASPNKLFDYAMAGLSLAASDLPFLAKVIEKHDMGKLFKKVDPEDIAETLNWLISHPSHLIQCKRNARTIAYESFYWEKQFNDNYPFFSYS